MAQPTVRLLIWPCLMVALSTAKADTPCADQAQQCALLVDELESQIQDVKNLAFKNCFGRNACVQEKVVFDDCYAQSLKAVRSPFLGHKAAKGDQFAEASLKYRQQLEQCFRTAETPSKPDFTSLLVDEDAIYARAIYGHEFADRLWDLADYGLDKPTLDPEDACLVRGPNHRIFGSGVARIREDPVGASFNNSCMFTQDEISCYRHFLDDDSQFKEMLRKRDRSLRSCIQGVRAQRRCRMNDSARVRACICNAREELETRQQSALLGCVRTSPLARLYSSIVELGAAPRTRAAAPRKTAKDADTLKELDDSPAPNSNAMSITQGVLLNGQCVCACAGAAPPTLFAGRPSAQFSTDAAAVAGGGAPDSLMAAQLQHQRLLQQYQQLSEQHRQLYHQQQQQQQQQQLQYPMMGASAPMGTVRSIEGGISDGFDRFFNGMPPIRRRDVARRAPRF